MATSVMQKPKTGTWSAIFPTEQVTQQQSALFVKKLLAVAISNITYLRTIFPEHAFGDRYLEDLSLKILRDDSACPGACQVIQWVKGCFDALDRKYLRMIILGIYVNPDDPMTAVETYTFKFDYSSQNGVTIFHNDTKVASAFTANETKRATIKLLRTIIVLTQTLQPLPDDVMMTMKLFYYDDVTPEDYEPPGFQSASAEDFKFEESPITIRIGDVSTSFHAVKLCIKTSSTQFTTTDRSEEMRDKVEDVASELGGVVHEDKDNVEEAKGHAHEPTESEQSCDQPHPLSYDEPHPLPKAEDNTVCCPCGVNEDDGLMVLCAVCQQWQHSVCFGLLEEQQVPDTHICITCSKKDEAQQCTDPTLTTLTKAQLQSICLWRRTLHACSDLTKLVTPGLARRLGVESSVAQGIMGRLEREGYIRTQAKGKKWGRVVLKDRVIEEGIPKYFPKTVAHNPPKGLSTAKPRQPQTNKVVDTIAHKTADLSISKAPIPAHVMEDTSGGEVRRSPRLRAKRVRSVVDESKEFELSCSQDQEQEAAMAAGERPHKRRKASITYQSIMV